MNSRTLETVVSDFIKNQSEEPILSALLALHASTRFIPLKEKCQELIEYITANSVERRASTDNIIRPKDLILYLFHQINNFLRLLETPESNAQLFKDDMEKLKDILVINLGMNPFGSYGNTAWHEAEKEPYLDNKKLNPSTSSLSSTSSTSSARKNSNALADLLNGDEFKINLIHSEVYQLMIAFINSVKLSKEGKLDPDNDRAAYWENFINLFNPNEKSAETWYLVLKFYYPKREYEMDQRIDPQKSQKRKSDDKRHPAVAILENSKINVMEKINFNGKEENISSFMLMSLFIRFLNDYLIQNQANKDIIPQNYQYARMTEKNSLNSKSPSEQFKHDVKVMEQGIMHPINPDNPLTQKRTNIKKRIFLMLQGCTDVALKNASASTSVPLYTSNVSQKNLDDVMPLASILGHGGRTTIEIPPIQEGDNPYQFLHWLLGGSDEVFTEALLPNNYLAEQNKKVVYNRRMATHSLDYLFDDVNKKWHIVETAPKKITDAATFAADAFGGRHFGFELPFMREDQAGPANGTYGHCYLYFLPPTKEKPGGILIGFEGSAYGVTGYFGGVHSTEAVSQSFSVTGGAKISPDKNRSGPSPFDHFPIRPDSLGGIKYTYTEEEIKELMLRTAADFKPKQLKNPAGKYLPAPAAKSTPKRFEKFIHYADPDTTERMKNAVIKLSQNAEQTVSGTLGKNYSPMPISTSKITDHPKQSPRVENTNLFFGGHLTKETVTDLKLKNPNVKIIQVAILNMFEFASTTGIDPISPAQCSEYNIIKQSIFPMDDNAGDKVSGEDYLKTMATGTILVAAKAVHDAVKQAEKDKDTIVYVNCKSGIGRSTMIMVVYYALFSEVEPFLSYRNNPKIPTSLLLKESTQYVKKFRTGANLHDEYLTTMAQENNISISSLWQRLETDPNQLETEIKEKFGKKSNIGKLRLAYNTIEQARKNPKLDNHQRDYASEFFWDQFVQSSAYKHFIMYCVLLDTAPIRRRYEKIAGDTQLSQLLESFFTLLETNPNKAINTIKCAQDPNDANYNVIREILRTALNEGRDEISDDRGYIYSLEKIFNGITTFVNHYDGKYNQQKTFIASNPLLMSSSTSSTPPPQTTAALTPLAISTAQTNGPIQNKSAPPARPSTRAPAKIQSSTTMPPARPKTPAPSDKGFLSSSSRQATISSGAHSTDILTSPEWKNIREYIFSLGNLSAAACLQDIEEVMKESNNTCLTQLNQAKQLNNKKNSDSLFPSSSASSSAPTYQENVFFALLSTLKEVEIKTMLTLFDNLHQKFSMATHHAPGKKA